MVVMVDSLRTSGMFFSQCPKLFCESRKFEWNTGDFVAFRHANQLHWSSKFLVRGDSHHFSCRWGCVWFGRNHNRRHVVSRCTDGLWIGRKGVNPSASVSPKARVFSLLRPSSTLATGRTISSPIIRKGLWYCVYFAEIACPLSRSVASLRTVHFTVVAISLDQQFSRDEFKRPPEHSIGFARARVSFYSRSLHGCILWKNGKKLNPSGSNF